MTVKAKLLILNILLVGASLLFMGLALRASLYGNLSSDIDRQLEVEVVSAMVADSSHKFPINPPLVDDEYMTVDNQKKIKRTVKEISPDADRIVAKSKSGVVQVLRVNSGEIRLESNPAFPLLIPIGGPLESHAYDPAGVRMAEAKGRTLHDYTANGKPMRSLSAPISIGGKRAAIIQAVRPTDSLRIQIAGLDRSLLMLAPFAVVLSALLGLSLVGLTMQPLKRLANSANLLTPDLSGERLPVVGRDEFSQLAKTFNTAFERTAAAFEQQKLAIAQLERFTGDAGHELRTPLAAIKSGTSHLIHKSKLTPESELTIRLMDRSADRMAKLIDDLLLLSRQDSGQPLSLDDNVHLAKLIEEAREELPNREGVEVEIDVDQELAVNGNEDALRRVFLNLLSNAISYARSRVTVIARFEQPMVTIEVADDGCGIAPEFIGRLGERFYRPDSARSRELGGTGLGLAIAKSLIAAHGGQLRLESELGKGTKVTVLWSAAIIRRLERADHIGLHAE